MASVVGSGKRGWVSGWGLLALLIAAGPSLFLRLTAHGFTDNEAMYAEIARQMLRTGDWVTPHLNGAPYLNKPPLTFWLTAALFRITGWNESVRLLSGMGFLLTAVVLWDLARVLWPGRKSAPLWTAAIFLSFAQTSVEARFLRPDPLLVLFVTVAAWGAARACSTDAAADRQWGVGALWGGIGLAVMAKGLVGVLLPALMLPPCLLLSGQWREWRRLCPPWAVALALLLILPWHVLAGLRNPGFWWDYVVNQHILFFFDRKFPRDSVPDGLLLTWGSFAGRLVPWVFFVPPALALQWRAARITRSTNDWLPLVWFGSIGLFFSLSKGRQLHYLMPAIPALALMLGALCHEWSQPASTRQPSRARRALFLLPVALAVAAAVVISRGIAGLLAELDPRLPAAALQVFLVLGAGAVLSAMLAGTKRIGPALAVLAVTGLITGVAEAGAMDRADRCFSVRDLAQSVPPALLSGSEVAYEAGDEYQLCGSLNYYLRRDVVLLLEPPGFVPPTYLARDVRHLFTKRAAFWEAWKAGSQRYLLFSDPAKPLDRREEFPQPNFEVGRGGGRALLTNVAVQPSSATPQPEPAPTGLPKDP